MRNQSNVGHAAKCCWRTHN